MRSPSYQKRSDISENMMTSMIDVVFLLLIFFVCAATGQVRESLLPADLPAGSVAAQAHAQPAKQPVTEVWIYLSVGEKGRILMKLNDTVYSSFAELKKTLLQLAEIAPESPVVLDIAPEVPAGDMVHVYDTCRGAKFESINFAVKAAKIATPE